MDFFLLFLEGLGKVMREGADQGRLIGKHDQVCDMRFQPPQKNLEVSVVTHIFNLSTWEEDGGISVSWRRAWSR